MRTCVLLAVTLFALPGFAEEAPLGGDVGHGAELFKAHCLSCHGAAGATHPGPRLNDAGLLSMHSDDELTKAVMRGSAHGMPAFPKFPQLDLLDVLAYLRKGQPRATDYFPDAAFFMAKAYTLDADARKRAEDAIGHAISDAEATLPVVTFYGHRDAATPGPEQVAQDPVSLDKLKPKDKVGYVLFLDLPTGSKTDHTSYALVLAKDGRILRIDSGSHGREYEAFVGEGHKGQDVLLKPKGKSVAPRYAAAFSRGFVRALEAVTMFDKDERDRHWADTN